MPRVTGLIIYWVVSARLVQGSWSLSTTTTLSRRMGGRAGLKTPFAVLYHGLLCSNIAPIHVPFTVFSGHPVID
jgi:hypothetical protein